MRIAILVSVMSGRGGIESAILRLVQGLNGLGDTTHVYLLGGATSDQQWLGALSHTILGNARQSRLRRFREYSFGLANEFRSFRPDVVIASDGPRLLKGKVALAISGHRAQLWSWIHFPLEHIAMPRMLKYADGHLAVSEGVAKQLRAFLGAGKSNLVVTTYYPIKTDVQTIPRPESGAPVVFLYIGRLQWDGQKRVNDLLATAARITGKFRLIIIGDGNDRPRLQQYSRELNLEDRIEWLGWKSDPWTAVPEASALVLASSYESFAIVLAESLARGVPCIVSDCKVGPDEIVEEGISGWFYPVGNVEALANRMQKVIDRPETLPRRQTLCAAVEKFSASAVAERAHRAFAETKHRNNM